MKRLFPAAALVIGCTLTGCGQSLPAAGNSSPEALAAKAADDASPEVNLAPENDRVVFAGPTGQETATASGTASGPTAGAAPDDETSDQPTDGDAASQRSGQPPNPAEGGATSNPTAPAATQSGAALSAPGPPATNGTASGAANGAAAQPNVEVRPPRKVGGKLELNFDHLKFNIEKGAPFERSMLTQEIENYAGQRVRIAGYILPTSVFTASGIKRFILVRDNQECCFGPGAAIYDCIDVHMVEGASADYTIRPVKVEGVFDIREFKDFDGVTRAIYYIAGESVR
jgi:hypothetical protein